MSKDRSVATDALEVLGTIIDGVDVGRDAIHLAVEPARAGETLAPGVNIRRCENGNWVSCRREQRIAIVDPFLPDLVKPGQKFLAIVPPREITSLRHVWSHPAFAEEAGPRPVSSRDASEAWMMAWAKEHMSDDYYGSRDKLSDAEAYAFAIRAGEENYVGPYEDARDHIDGEWWRHWEAITGKVGDRDTYFSCGC